MMRPNNDDHSPPRQSGAGTAKLLDAVRVMRVRPRLYRVESRNRHVLRDVPEALVAPPDGTRTTVFAVLRSTESRRPFNNKGLRESGQAHAAARKDAA